MPCRSPISSGSSDRYAPRVPSPTSTERTVASSDPAATRDIGRRLAEAARPGDLVLLYGELGAGKTQLVKGFGAGLGVVDTINSPSFVLMSEYDGRIRLFHLDLYRLEGPSEVLAGGLVDERQDVGVAIVEWADRLGTARPAARLDVEIDGTGDELREIRVRATDRAYARYLDVLP
jgi:tRNA threonylcarbamoyladenosine biosynthesis protein TsaE